MCLRYHPTSLRNHTVSSIKKIESTCRKTTLCQARFSIKFSLLKLFKTGFIKVIIKTYSRVKRISTIKNGLIKRWTSYNRQLPWALKFKIKIQMNQLLFWLTHPKTPKATLSIWLNKKIWLSLLLIINLLNIMMFVEVN